MLGEVKLIDKLEQLRCPIASLCRFANPRRMVDMEISNNNMVGGYFVGQVVGGGRCLG